MRLSRSIASNVSEPNDEKDCGADRNAVSASVWLRPSVGVKNVWEEFGCEDVNGTLSGISGSKIATAKSCLSSRVSRNRRRSFVLCALCFVLGRGMSKTRNIEREINSVERTDIYDSEECKNGNQLRNIAFTIKIF